MATFPEWIESTPKAVTINYDNILAYADLECSLGCYDVPVMEGDVVCTLPEYLKEPTEAPSTTASVDDITAAIANITTGETVGATFTNLIDISLVHLDKLLKMKRINAKVHTEMYLALLGKAMDSATATSEFILNAEAGKVATQLSIDAFSLDRFSTIREMEEREHTVAASIKETCASINSTNEQIHLSHLKFAIEANNNKMVFDQQLLQFRNDQLGGYWDRALKAISVRAKDSQMQLFTAQIKGFTDKKQGEVIGKLIDTWTISATEELENQWQMDFNKRYLTDPSDINSDLQRSSLEDWIRDYVSDTDNIGQ